MKNTNMNGQNIRKTALAAIAALTMVLTTSCSSVADITPPTATVPEVTAAQTEVQPEETEAPETEATETEESAETTTESKEESKADTASSKTASETTTKKKPAQTTASKPKPTQTTASKPKPSSGSSSGNTSGGSSSKAPAQTTTKAPEPQPEHGVAQPIDITVDRILGSSVRELLDLSSYDYEYVNYVYGTQCDPVAIKCRSFPEYAIVPDTTYAEGEPQNELEIPTGDGNRYIIGNRIKMLNLTYNASVEGVATVGMPYNELKDIFAAYGSDFKVYFEGDTLGYRAHANINGHDWYFGFMLTDDDKDEIYSRMQELAGDEDVTVSNAYDYRVDISDINPTCFVAVYNVY